MKRLGKINCTGIRLTDDSDIVRLKDIRVFVENGSVQLWIEIRDGREYMQYLTAVEAMAFAKAFDRLAIESLRASAGE